MLFRVTINSKRTRPQARLHLQSACCISDLRKVSGHRLEFLSCSSEFGVLMMKNSIGLLSSMVGLRVRSPLRKTTLSLQLQPFQVSSTGDILGCTVLLRDPFSTAAISEPRRESAPRRPCPAPSSKCFALKTIGSCEIATRQMSEDSSQSPRLEKPQCQLRTYRAQRD